MAYTTLDQLAERVSGQPKRIMAAIAPEEDHALEAILHAEKQGLITPLLFGKKNVITELLQKLGANPAAFTIENHETPEEAAYAAGMAVKNGQAHFLMKCLISTGALLKTLFKEEVGFRVGKVVSHLSINQVPNYHKLVAITDAAINIAPDLEQKKILIENAVRTLRMLGINEPRVAVLSATETLNPKMADSVDADALKQMCLRGEIAGCVVEGPLSYDLAMSKEAAAIKGVTGPVFGDADLLVCPCITTANVLLKSWRYAAGAVSAGIVVGGKVPIVLTSRAASTQDKYWPMVLAASATI